MFFVDEDRIVEAERRDAVGNLADLPARMRAGVARVGLEGRDRPDDDLQIVKRPLAARMIVQGANSCKMGSRVLRFDHDETPDGNAKSIASRGGLGPIGRLALTLKLPCTGSRLIRRLNPIQPRIHGNFNMGSKKLDCKPRCKNIGFHGAARYREIAHQCD